MNKLFFESLSIISLIIFSTIGYIYSYRLIVKDTLLPNEVMTIVSFVFGMLIMLLFILLIRSIFNVNKSNQIESENRIGKNIAFSDESRLWIHKGKAEKSLENPFGND
jgi:uncharacterized membrane protein